MNITAENVERLAKVEGNGTYLVQVESREIQRSPLAHRFGHFITEGK